MTETPNSPERKASFRSRLKDAWMRDRKKVIFLSGAGLILFIAGGVATVEVTSSNALCGLCHEMAPAFRSWEKSKHYKDSDGKIIASCRDCHLPPWSHPFQLVVLKVHHSVKDGVRHFTDRDRLMEASYHAEMKSKSRRTMTSSSCLHCHSDIYSTKFYDKDSIHFLVRNIRGSRCLDCHKNLVHDPYPLVTEKRDP